MLHRFQKFECGETIPRNNIHAVSVSIPTLQDVLDYENKTEKIQNIIKSGYPRFVLHPYLKKVISFLRNKYNIGLGKEIILTSSVSASLSIINLFNLGNNKKFQEPFGILVIDKNDKKLKDILLFIQHSGYNLSSRFAEKYLFENKVINTIQKEEIEPADISESIIKNILADAYKQPVENVFLATSGMNAMYSVLTGLAVAQKKNQREIFIQVGWLYLDTMNLIKKYSDSYKIFFDVNNLDILEDFLDSNGLNTAAIITEIPTNPLVYTVDLKRLKRLADKYTIPIVVDGTIATPFNLDLAPYADIFVESLTKFACGNADVLMGAFIFNKDSSFKFDFSLFYKYSDQTFIGDMQRLAYEIKYYKTRIEKINQNTIRLVNYLHNNKNIKNVYWSLQDKCSLNYKKLMRTPDSVGGLISITLNKPFAEVYDNLNFPKGPSLGTEFTLLMPYVYLAHYDLITTVEGKRLLNENEIPAELIRISVGLENIEDIIEHFEEVLQ